MVCTRELNQTENIAVHISLVLVDKPDNRRVSFAVNRVYVRTRVSILKVISFSQLFRRLYLERSAVHENQVSSGDPAMDLWWGPGSQVSSEDPSNSADSATRQRRYPHDSYVPAAGAGSCREAPSDALLVVFVPARCRLHVVVLDHHFLRQRPSISRI